ncbi:alpha/beta hydrolase [Rhodococcus rhodnii]|uniref:Esterase n=2 Tax=Rhodococcus rhodnii TaxID=38312 RepID=R7WIP0_9NOCA|nr:alpha/beta hydrolase [Rhodococcus rhodnii]EOM75085.1 esterase [Rhodococcus rhodnii LMG 5362]TXG89319.1 alpha/beta hydrolase [Rhodococcus rhodnii]
MADAAPDPSSVRFEGPWVHRDVHAGGIRFHLAQAPNAGRNAPVMVLLHGFADFWWSWRHQLGPLTDAGYRVLAVDLRGYGDTDKPPRGYDGWTLANDVAGLIRAHGGSPATVVGHADGGLVAWATSILHPDLVHAAVSIAAPHPIALRRGALFERHQRAALLPSLLSHQLPWRPERVLTRNHGAEVERIVRARCGPAYTRSDEFDEVCARMRAAILIPGAAYSTLEYQRWAFRSQFRPDGRRFMAAMDVQVAPPVLQIHGQLDPFVLGRPVRESAAFTSYGRIHSVAGVGHYPHWEAPRRTNDAIVEFLGALPDRRS